LFFRPYSWKSEYPANLFAQATFLSAILGLLKKDLKKLKILAQKQLILGLLKKDLKKLKILAQKQLFWYFYDYFVLGYIPRVCKLFFSLIAKMIVEKQTYKQAISDWISALIPVPVPRCN
jgi:hypothetical protein